MIKYCTKLLDFNVHTCMQRVGSCCHKRKCTKVARESVHESTHVNHDRPAKWPQKRGSFRYPPA